jgi:hypothetical protein
LKQQAASLGAKQHVTLRSFCSRHSTAGLRELGPPTGCKSQTTNATVTALRVGVDPLQRVYPAGPIPLFCGCHLRLDFSGVANLLLTFQAQIVQGLGQARLCSSRLSGLCPHQLTSLRDFVLRLVTHFDDRGPVVCVALERPREAVLKVLNLLCIAGFCLDL